MAEMYKSYEIADRIKITAKAKNISISTMLSEIGLGKNTLMNFKTSMPKADNIAKVADYLDVSVDYLLGRTKEPAGYNNINNIDTTVNGTQANVIHKNNDDDLNDIKNTLNQLSKANRFRAIADILDLIDEKYLKK